ncbi:hypothetical protein COEREDRAFT_12706 [Coemansia reversa NRRL 1564]|uniref:Uncharacterized protein n=1 Tax=Coemansia reversa (strain ATCC 12441 / NRRL 1564) TaxID=763665 RepID=A0A2G5B0F4_COERN|nr:hypothetical protein COEREDRAFT_12706 [Coemansia reversa NRRL 1564]|eukprot:PIA12502.1 hypothetical protein COEREDRAFT_12706 [Coemansia reversa NRRL 1564]
MLGSVKSLCLPVTHPSGTNSVTMMPLPTLVPTDYTFFFEFAWPLPIIEDPVATPWIDSVNTAPNSVVEHEHLSIIENALLVCVAVVALTLGFKVTVALTKWCFLLCIDIVEFIFSVLCFIARFGYFIATAVAKTSFLFIISAACFIARFGYFIATAVAKISFLFIISVVSPCVSITIFVACSYLYGNHAFVHIQLSVAAASSTSFEPRKVNQAENIDKSANVALVVENNDVSRKPELDHTQASNSVQGLGSSLEGGANLSIGRRSAHRTPYGCFWLPKHTAIKSNCYYADEMLRDSDLEDQEFDSSDEEDFMAPTRGYRGDIMAQQQLIKKQERTLFDLNMRSNMLIDAFKCNKEKPYKALVDNYEECCKHNRRAKSEIARLRSEIERLQGLCAQPEDAPADYSS